MIQAAAEGDVDKLHQCFKLGASVNAKDHTGRTALHLASAEGHGAAVELLVGRRAELDIQDKVGRVPLQEAMMNGHLEVVAILMKAGANHLSQLQTEMEWTLRHTAFHGRLESVDCLVRSGVDVNARDYHGKTALTLASENSHRHIVSYLRSHGAADAAKDNDETYLPACEQGNPLLYPKQNNGPPSLDRQRNAHYAVLGAFPPPVAAAILRGSSAAAIERDCASLLVADVCGFTALSGALPPAAVSHLVGALFRKFDRLAHLHGVQPVDTAGDAYVAAANFTVAQACPPPHPPTH